MAIADSISTLEQLRTERAKFNAALVAPNTQNGYRYDQAAFRAWAAQAGLDSFPASPETLSLYVTSLLVRKLKVSTIGRHVAAIAHMHRSSGYPSPADEGVRGLMRGARRLRVESLRQVLPVTLEELRSMALLLLADDTPISIRNWAILMTGFTGALRNSSTAALLLSDVEFLEKGATLNIRRSKTDQEGTKAQLIGLPFGKHPETCPVTALKKWIERRGSFAGVLFTRCDQHLQKERPLQPERIGQIVQEQLQRIGVNWRAFGGHSLRSGFCTEAGIAMVGELCIASQTGHKDLQTLRRYFRKRDAFVANPVAMLDL